MTTGYQIRDQSLAYFVTFTIADWVDIFTRRIYKDIIMASLDYCIKNKELVVLGYVIMSNHVHLILSSRNGKLSDTIRDFKKYTANQILSTIEDSPESRREWMLHRFKWNAANHQRNSHYQVWTHENHAIEIRTKHFFEQKLNYIHQNPVRAGLVDFPEDYVCLRIKRSRPENYFRLLV
ncbi:REP-associated tyrosine transposase [Taibaiella soli]|uniref:Transposase n=1 Tax=Taibaiella soli TaxID=1649169 RepID=A0A2W2AWV9_9BACT|nr:transposase [Taibaiella soli]